MSSPNRRSTGRVATKARSMPEQGATRALGVTVTLGTVAKAIAAIGVAFASFAWLAYWTGRWYKEWYFSEFQIPYEILDFDGRYYMYGSWATVGVALSALAIMLNLGASVWARDSRRWLAFSALIVALAIAVVLFNPFAFNPYDPFFPRFLGSSDLLLMALGVFASLAAAILLYRRRGKLATLLQRGRHFRQKSAGATAVLAAAMFLALALSVPAYLAVLGYAMGQYHARSAIWEGKMGLRWVKVKGEWWILVVRASNDRVFIFDRVGKRTRCVHEADIEEFDGAVTAAPK
jgi:hypothetical protein